MNVLFFIGTVYYLVDHWRKAAGVINSQVVEIPIWNKYSFQPFANCPKQSLRAQVRSNFLIVLKLFFIMGTFQVLINKIIKNYYYWIYLQGSRGCLSLPHSWSLTTGGLEKSTKIIIEKLKNGDKGKINQNYNWINRWLWEGKINQD